MSKKTSLLASALGALSLGGLAAPLNGVAFAQSRMSADPVQPVYAGASSPTALPGAALSASSLDTASVTTKSSAILGGAPSALEAIRLQQAPDRGARETDALGYADLIRTGAASSLAAGWFNSNRATSHLPTTAIDRIISDSIPGKKSLISQTDARGLALTNAAITTVHTERETFLQSPRVRIGRTRLDSQWDRVARQTLTLAAVTEALGSGRGLILHDLLVRVNAWGNGAIQYEEDWQQWGDEDRWSDAPSTLSRRRGDCEDIAILKYQALRALGVPAADMFVTIARDTVRRADHALLVVRTEGGFVLLDNATDALLDGSMDHDYVPVLSFNEEGSWLHGRAPNAAPSPLRLAYLSRSEVSSARFIGFSK